MRTIVHISDIHFGRVDYAIAESIIVKINEIAPDLVVVSGDLTQRARSAQFIEAKAFLDKLPQAANRRSGQSRHSVAQCL
jgi:3',5'-cyclic AMP phosphodiesterase CpdA